MSALVPSTNGQVQPAGERLSANGRTVADVQGELAAPFGAADVKALPKVVSKDGTTAMAIFYIDARTVEDRLDAVVGVCGWQDDFEILEGGNVRCVLSILFGSEWIRKSDVGSPSEQPNAGDRLKSAYSDALKRAAVKFGIGRYLYDLPTVWHEFDSQKKRFKSPVPIPTAGKADTTSGGAAKGQAAAMPKTIGELIDRLTKYNAKLVKDGLCRTGDVFAVVQEFALRCPKQVANAELIEEFPTSAIPAVVECVKKWADGLTAQQKANADADRQAVEKLAREQKAGANGKPLPPSPPTVPPPAALSPEQEAEERSDLLDGLYEMARNRNTDAALLIEAHCGPLGINRGTDEVPKKFSALSTSQMRTLTTVLNNLKAAKK